MKIADQIKRQQNKKEMTRRAIKLLISLDPNSKETKAFCNEFKSTYGEAVE